MTMANYEANYDRIKEAKDELNVKQDAWSGSF